MESGMVRIVCVALAIVLIAAIVIRRRKKQTE